MKVKHTKMSINPNRIITYDEYAQNLNIYAKCYDIVTSGATLGHFQ